MCDNILSSNQYNPCLSLCFKAVVSFDYCLLGHGCLDLHKHDKRLHRTRRHIIVWTDYFSHKVNALVDRHSTIKDIMNSDRARSCLHQTDWSRQGARPGQIWQYNREFSFLVFCLKPVSYVLRQMVNVHWQWVCERKNRKKTGDENDASVQRRRQQIALAIMCLAVCLAVCLGQI